MARPSSRPELIEYCLRKLGKPTVNINVADVQINDRVDDALQKYLEYHYEGREEHYIIHELTQAEIDAQEINLPSEVVAVREVFTRTTGYTQGGGLFTAEYQVHLSDYLHGGSFSFGTGGLSNFYLLKRNFSEFQHLFRPEIGFTYNRVSGKLRFFGGIREEGTSIAIRVYSYFQMDTNGDVAPMEVWNDDWLKRYTTALIKRQWGENMKKFQGVELVGGLVLNGKEIYDEAVSEIDELEKELESRFQLPIVPVMA